MNSLNTIEEQAMSSPRRPVRSTLVTALSATVLIALLAACRTESPNTFRSPEDAIAALDAALASGDDGGEDVEILFGPGSLEHLRSGDPVADKEDVARVRALIAEGVAYEDLDDHTKGANFGKDPWPFPFPLVSEGGKWHFDLEGGIEELHNQRIGSNELSTLATLHAYVDAQREYYRARPMGEPPVFAQRFMSEEGARNGLYWPTAEGEESSPFGELVAEADQHGYETGKSSESTTNPAGYQGYLFKILTGQGEHVPAGARSYLDADGGLRTGFALVAWPASYGNSGIMTFQVNHWGMVFQKDLGAATATAAPAIAAYDPDETWAPTGD